MGAVTVAIKKRYYTGGGKNVIADVTWSSSYATGGDTYTNSQFELDTIDYIEGGIALGASSVSYAVAPDLANKKLRLHGGAASGVGLAEAANASSQTGTVARLHLHGNDGNL